MADDDTETLIAEWGQENVDAAFWLQAKIKRDGLDGIGYMESARNHLRSTGEFTVKRKMESHMDGDY